MMLCEREAAKQLVAQRSKEQSWRHLDFVVYYAGDIR